MPDTSHSPARESFTPSSSHSYDPQPSHMGGTSHARAGAIETMQVGTQRIEQHNVDYHVDQHMNYALMRKFEHTHLEKSVNKEHTFHLKLSRTGSSQNESKYTAAAHHGVQELSKSIQTGSSRIESKHTAAAHQSVQELSKSIKTIHGRNEESSNHSHPYQNPIKKVNINGAKITQMVQINAGGDAQPHDMKEFLRKTKRRLLEKNKVPKESHSNIIPEEDGQGRQAYTSYRREKASRCLLTISRIAKMKASIAHHVNHDQTKPTNADHIVIAERRSPQANVTEKTQRQSKKPNSADSANTKKRPTIDSVDTKPSGTIKPLKSVKKAQAKTEATALVPSHNPKPLRVKSTDMKTARPEDLDNHVAVKLAKILSSAIKAKAKAGLKDMNSSNHKKVSTIDTYVNTGHVNQKLAKKLKSPSTGAKDQPTRLKSSPENPSKASKTDKTEKSDKIGKTDKTNKTGKTTGKTSKTKDTHSATSGRTTKDKRPLKNAIKIKVWIPHIGSSQTNESDIPVVHPTVGHNKANPIHGVVHAVQVGVHSFIQHQSDSSHPGETEPHGNMGKDAPGVTEVAVHSVAHVEHKLLVGHQVSGEHHSTAKTHSEKGLGTSAHTPQHPAGVGKPHTSDVRPGVHNLLAHPQNHPHAHVQSAEVQSHSQHKRTDHPKISRQFKHVDNHTTHSHTPSTAGPSNPTSHHHPNDHTTSHQQSKPPNDMHALQHLHNQNTALPHPHVSDTHYNSYSPPSNHEMPEARLTRHSSHILKTTPAPTLTPTRTGPYTRTPIRPRAPL
ncbi:hypothetical protein CC86DRAFT_452029 [Ophiobolus disseminans]|uniref:Uncharacterized protein n=1 Tax=Ophiobolus disseminans TaxID=1469910 RepID=A0A6A7AH56_9PLEO|nr:hypothetical protein CC86DRAFT_452029 [Ophiobolus disseminans]